MDEMHARTILDFVRAKLAVDDGPYHIVALHFLPLRLP